jgi:hypothetical protein
MLPQMPKIPNLVATQAADGLHIEVAPGAVLEDFVALLHWLPRGYGLHFYDQYYPTISDPGAYVEVQRNAEFLLYMVANHGWSSNWSRQSGELLAAWLALNMKQKHPFSAPLTSLTVRQAAIDPWQRT